MIESPQSRSAAPPFVVAPIAGSSPLVRAFHFHPPWEVIAPGMLFILILLAFLPALMAGFVDWDDDNLLFKTTSYRTLNLDTLRWMFTTSYSGHFQPLTWLSYSLDWALWKRNSFGYHLTSVLLHAFTAVTVYFVAGRLISVAYRTSRASPGVELSRKRDPALILCSALAAALFAIHPLRVESVAWLSERRDVLSGFFFVTAVAAYLLYAAWRLPTRPVSNEDRRGQMLFWYIAALALQLVSLLAKATATTLPLVLLILDVYPLRRLARRDAAGHRPTFRVVMEKAPFFLLSIIGGLRAWRAQAETGAMYSLAEYGPPARLAQACYGLAFYVGKMVWPSGLGPLYQLPTRGMLPGAAICASAIVVALLAALAIALRRRAPGVTAALAVYAVVLSPVLGFFQSGPQLVADRYSYIACIGFVILAAAGLWALVRRAAASPARRRPAATILGCAVVLTALFHATAAQSNFWSSSLHLWDRGVKVSPDSSIAHAKYADALAALGDLPDAAWHYRESLKFQPLDAITANHYADVLLRLGDRARAKDLYQRTLRLDPNRAGAYLKLAQLLVMEKHAAQAADLLRKRVDDAAGDLEAARFLAELLSTHPDSAVRNGAEAATLAARVTQARGDGDARALLIWATALAEAGRYDEGISAARRALGIAENNLDDRLAGELRRRLALFEQHKPFHVGD